MQWNLCIFLFSHLCLSVLILLSFCWAEFFNFSVIRFIDFFFVLLFLFLVSKIGFLHTCFFIPSGIYLLTWYQVRFHFYYFFNNVLLSIVSFLFYGAYMYGAFLDWLDFLSFFFLPLSISLICVPFFWENSSILSLDISLKFLILKRAF